MNDVKQREQESIRRCILSHPVLMLRGPEQTGVVRSIAAVLGEYVADGERQEVEEMVWQGVHSDLILYDGRELSADDARNIRQFATSCPANWPRRFVIISYIHRCHYVTMPILLKLIEEPPDHFSIILTTSNEGRVLSTILSRSLQLKISPSDKNEVTWWLRKLKRDEDELRVKACGGDLNVAESLDLHVIKEWYNDLSAVLVGSDFRKNFLATWVSRLEEASEQTQVACWDLLVQMVVSVLDSNKFWVGVGLVAMEARNQVQSGFINKMSSTTMLFKIYSIAKTVVIKANR